MTAEHEDTEIVEFLIIANADINPQNLSGFTPLHLAVDIESDGAIQNGALPMPKVSKMLLDYFADVSLRDMQIEHRSV